MSAIASKLPRQRRLSVGMVLLYLGLVVLSIITLMPIVFMYTRALLPESLQMVWPVIWIPNPPTFENLQRIFNDPTLPVFRWLINSVMVATAVTALVLFMSSLTAYAYARLEFPGRDTIFFILLTSLMVPSAVTFIPNFMLMRDLKWLNSYHGLIWIHGAGVFGVFLLRQHFLTIPKELEEAAIVDGASRFRIYWQICLPLVASAMVALGIFTFLGNWNDLFWPLIILSSREAITLPVGLLVLTQSGYVQRGLAFSGGFIATVPPLIVYGIFQRQIIQGMTTAGLAGR